ncbi:unnamed protein product [Adineta ricciae]|uniref:G-protein coupled receptors family 1 profile domain-containing protein n=1 Tax=Adineta ricciae TaxID=249248 RepID=A0A814UQJ9_ADIRI|nr:unnamed protein product [Adineta ricciae]CAF1177188.1 unnamed protein product [Adineta ricciae]
MLNTSTVATALKLTINTPKYYNKFQQIQMLLVKFTNPYILIISCIGLIANSSTIVLLSRSFITKNLRHKWTLIALACSDLILNIALLIRVIHDVNKWDTQRLCLTISFLSQLAELLSAYLTVLFTIQRYIAVRYPIQAATQRRSAPIIPLGCIFFFSCVFCWALIHFNPHVNCQEEFNLIWFIGDALCSFIIPFSLILIFNILIVNLIRQHARSAIIANSTVPRQRKKDRNAQQNRALNEDTYSRTCSYTCLPTSQGQYSDDGIPGKDTSDNSLNKNVLTIQQINSDETELVDNEMCATKVKVEIVGKNAVVYNHCPSLLQHSGSLRQKPVNNISLKSNFSREGSEHFSSKDAPTNQSIRVTRMLLLVSTCFLVLNAPAHICLIVVKIHSTIDGQIFSQHAALDHFQEKANLTTNQLKNLVFIEIKNHTISDIYHPLSDNGEIVDDQILIHLLFIAVFFTQLFSYTSYSINFFLYSYSGMAFRTGLRQFLNKLR